MAAFGNLRVFAPAVAEIPMEIARDSRNGSELKMDLAAHKDLPPAGYGNSLSA
jgi:hypothetical protein